MASFAALASSTRIIVLTESQVVEPVVVLASTTKRPGKEEGHLKSGDVDKGAAEKEGKRTASG